MPLLHNGIFVKIPLGPIVRDADIGSQCSQRIPPVRYVLRPISESVQYTGTGASVSSAGENLAFVLSWYMAAGRLLRRGRRTPRSCVSSSK